MSLSDQYAAFTATHPVQRWGLNGQVWAYIDVGVGARPLVMLPGGFGMAHTSWQYLAALQAQTRVIAVHYPPTATTLAELSDSLALLLDHLGLAQVDLLGGSASGFVAQVLVRRHPQRVATLILAQSGAPQPRRAHLARYCAALFERAPLPTLYGLLRLAIYGFLPGVTESRHFWRRHFAAVLAAQSRIALVNRFRLAADFDANYSFTPNDLADWPGRIALIESQADRTVGTAERATLRTLYPQARVITLAGRHGASVEEPAAQIAALRTLITYPGG